MKSRALPSNKRRVPLIRIPAAALRLFIAALAAAFFCQWVVAGKEGVSDASKGSDAAQMGTLTLADPEEETLFGSYEMAVGDVFSIEFIHSVNKSPVIDYFELREDGIYGLKTVYYGFGAGVPTDLGEGQTLTRGEDGSMTISGFEMKFDDLIYRVGTVSDHTLTLPDGTGVSLRDLCGRNARVGFRFELLEE